MPTTRTRYVNTASSSGGDGTTNNTAGATRAYVSLSEAITAEKVVTTNFVTSDIVLDILCEGTAADTTAVDINGITTDATRYLRIRGNNTAAGKHAGSFSTGKYRLTSTGFNGPMIIGINHCRIENIQISADGNDANRSSGISIENSSGEIYILGNIVRYNPAGTPTTSSGNHGITDLINAQNGYKLVIVNNVVYGFKQTGILLNNNGQSSQVYVVYNNTVAKCDDGIGLYMYGGTDTLLVKDNIMRGNTTHDYYLESSATTYTTSKNITSDNTSPDGASYRSKTPSFTDYTGNDFTLSTGDTIAKDAGDDLSADATYAFSIDNIGTTRPDGAAWDIGANEAVAGGGGGSSKPFGYFMSLGG